jgi:hypothetical protein
MEQRMINNIALVTACVLSLVSCMSIESQYNDEAMYDHASRLKDVSQAVDGLIKFGDPDGLEGDQLILKAVNNDTELLQSFGDYTLKVDIQGDHAVLLLCDADKVLIEDAGCNVGVDATYWSNVKPNSCAVVLKASDVCN